MAAKRKPSKKKTAAAAEPEPPQPPPAPLYTCRKCGNHESVTQLRKVVVDVGWAITQIHAIAPCVMCSKCGNNTVTVNARIGDLAGLVPDLPMAQNVEDCDRRIAELEALKAQLTAKRGKGKRKAAKKRKG